MMLATLASCTKDDSNSFSVNVPEEGITFEEMPGAAVMKYNLPANQDIYAIRAEYKDYKDRSITKEGTYQGNMLVLDGFVEAKKDVDVKITFYDKNDKASKSVNRKFSVANSVPKEVMNSVKLKKFWHGFSVQYDCEDEPTGLIHIGKLGIGQHGTMDTLLIETKRIEQGKVQLDYFEVADTVTNTTDVVVWAEDFSGNILDDIKAEKIKAAIPALLKREVNGTINWDFWGSSYENEEYKMGKKYLWDGDKKGMKKWENDRVGKSMYVYGTDSWALPLRDWQALRVVLAEPQTLAGIRFYWPCAFDQMKYDAEFTGTQIVDWGFYAPCKWRLYVRESADSDRVLIRTVDQSRIDYPENRWTKHFNHKTAGILTSEEEFKKAKAPYEEISIPLTESKYQIVEIEVDEVFWDNLDIYQINYHHKQFALSELEVYIDGQKEE
jgi:hypothetical protein